MRLRAFAVVGLVAVVAASYAGAAGAPGIEGTYRLAKRVMSDGSVLTPPAVFGFQTYGHGVRNFNVKWTQPDGTPSSLSLTSHFELKGGKYCEKPMFWLSNNVGAPGLSYTWPPEKEQCSDVTSTGGSLTFAIKGEPVVVTFGAGGFSAKAEGIFTDVWERVK